jgi:hypothetical protein
VAPSPLLGAAAAAAALLQHSRPLIRLPISQLLLLAVTCSLWRWGMHLLLLLLLLLFVLLLG